MSVLEPLAALLEGEVGELGDVVLAEPLVEPPDADDEEDGLLLSMDPDAVPDADPDAEPDGELGVDGVVVAPDEDVEPDEGVRETARSSLLSQPVSIPAPSARDTATANVVSLIV